MKPPKKPYTTPVLTVYGNLQQLTNSVGGMGAMDGAKGMGVNKTHARKIPRPLFW